MSSDQLLLHSLSECCRAIEEHAQQLLDLKNTENFSSYWVQGIEAELRKQLNELEQWQKKLIDREALPPPQRQPPRPDDVVKQDLARCDCVKELLSHINELIKQSSQPCERAQCHAILNEIEEDVKSIAEFSAGVKLYNTPSKDVKPHIQEDQDLIASIRNLFKGRIRGLLPQLRAESFSMNERGCVQFEEQDWFWSKILRPPGMTRFADRYSRYDGIRISDAHIEKAKGVLMMFIEAWQTVNPEHSNTYPIDPPSLENMQYMPSIACVLYACNKHRLFNKFIAAEIWDSALEDGLDAFRARVVDAIQSAPEAAAVVAQFSRVIPRAWPDGHDLELESSEPLPLLRRRQLRTRQGLGVYEVQDTWDPTKFYALKVVEMETANEKQCLELDNEIAQLRSLGQENHGHHIVKCLKTYRRGKPAEEIGMLLVPVADRDLNKLLLRCSQDSSFRAKHRTELFRTFGCLSYSLAYLHNEKRLRHRDVKPHNILYHRPNPHEPGTFFWADFGLAIVFREQGFSGEANPKFGATPEYEAPEIDYQNGSVHTRAADVFALGCTFLEIVWVLSLQGNVVHDNIQIRSDYWVHSKNEYYKHHLTGLNGWITTLEARLRVRREKTLSAILSLAKRMIRKKKEDRPHIHEVVLALWKLKIDEPMEKLFCLQCAGKMKTDLGPHPQHPNIFTHDDDKHRSTTHDHVSIAQRIAAFRVG